MGHEKDLSSLWENTWEMKKIWFPLGKRMGNEKDLIPLRENTWEMAKNPLR